MKILQAYKNSVEKLKTAKIHNAEQECFWIFEYLFNYSPQKLLLDNFDEFSDSQWKKLENIIEKRAQNYPLQYLIGHTEFYGLQLKVTPDVLIPRPETEILIEKILNEISKLDNLKCADLGTGSGCIALALSAKLPNSEWHVCDISQKALDIAKFNYDQLNLKNKFNFYCGSWFDAFPNDLKFDLIVTNPPYVGNTEKIGAEVAHEPKIAVFSNGDSYANFEIIFDKLKCFSHKDTLFMTECGINQADKLVQEIKKRFNIDAEVICDLTQQPRFVFFRLS